MLKIWFLWCKLNFFQENSNIWIFVVRCNDTCTHHLSIKRLKLPNFLVIWIIIKGKGQIQIIKCLDKALETEPACSRCPWFWFWFGSIHPHSESHSSTASLQTGMPPQPNASFQKTWENKRKENRTTQKGSKKTLPFVGKLQRDAVEFNSCAARRR